MFLIEILPPQVDDVRDVSGRSGRRRRRAAAADPGAARAGDRRPGARRQPRESFEDVRRKGRSAREYTDHLSRSPRAEREGRSTGAFWTGEPPLPEDAAGRSLGRAEHPRALPASTSATSMRFDVARPRRSRRASSSVRDVEWEDARNGGFMFVFRPGPFAHAPQTWIGILQAPADPAARGRFQRDLVAQFPERLGDRRRARSWPRSSRRSTT